jgi:hypothetical protein
LVGIGVAIALHAIIFTLMAIFGFDLTPYPENEPVFVTLPDYEEPEPEPEPIAPEPVEPEPAEIAPEPQEQPEAQTPRSAQSAAPPATSPDPAPSQGARTPAPPTQGGATAPVSQEPLPWQEQGASDRGATRTRDDELFDFQDDEATGDELPDWVVSGQVVQPIDTLEASDQATLADKVATLPGFDERLDRLLDSLSNPAGPASVAGPEQTGNENVSRQDLPGNNAIEWVGSGPRGVVSELTLPRLTASDFGGTVPARVNYIIVFDVNDAGVVVPGSLILRQSSGYTQADQKVRRAVSSWRFDPAPGTPNVTAIATLQISRDEIR